MSGMSVYGFRLLAAGAGVAMAFGGISAARGAMNQNPLFRVGSFTQASGSVPTTADDYFFNARIFVDSGLDFDGATLTYPGAGSPGVYDAVPDPTEASGVFFSFSGPNESNLAALNADFPFGNYVTTATNSVTSASQTSSINYTTDAFSSTVPALTAPSFAAAQGMNPRVANTLNLTAFVPNGAANETDVFFSIFDGMGNTVFNLGFLPATTTSVTIPANTLAANAAYSYQVIFSDRINNTSADGVFQVLGFDLDTNGTLVTTPEPASLAAGATGLIMLMRRRR
jgi:hypothetical protein